MYAVFLLCTVWHAYMHLCSMLISVMWSEPKNEHMLKVLALLIRMCSEKLACQLFISSMLCKFTFSFAKHVWEEVQLL